MDQNKIRELIIERGCFSKKENKRIYNDFFKIIPKYLYHNLHKYMLYKKKVLDVGCGYGNYLIHFGKESLGIDINPRYLRFLKSVGLKHIQANFEDKLKIKQETFDGVWCSNVLEHMVAPHFLLIKLHKILKDDGLLFIYVPLVPFVIFRKIRAFQDYLASEHINFFTSETLKLTIKRSGFELIDINTAFTYNIAFNTICSPIFNIISPAITIVAKKKADFRYPNKRIVEFTPKWMKKHMGHILFKR